MLESTRLRLPLVVCIEIIFVVGISASLVFGQTTGQTAFPSAVPQPANSQATPPAPPPPSTPPTGMRLGPADLVEITVYGVPELSQKVRVNDSGDIYLPLVDYVRVEGLTPEEAQGVIEKRLADGGFVKNPHVVVLVTDSATSSISLLGEVAHPGTYNVLGERHLLDIISAAGGFTERSGRAVSITHRSNPTQTDLVKLPADLSPSSPGNVVVQPGDTIVALKGPVFYVVGDVGRASGFVSDSENLTILKAIALAGGPNKTAALNGTTILRKTPQGTEQIKIPLKQILRAKAKDIPMQSEDILFVPSSTRKVVMARSAEAVTQMATALTLVAVRP